MLGKKSSEKSAKNVLYIHTNIVTEKWRGKRRAKHFFEKHTDSARIKCSEKSAKERFYIHSNIVSKIWGKKTRETFSRNTRIVEHTMLV